ncbi:MAG: type I-C CRISPR-associated protein Cas7/Csd2 [Ignavibacterium album]|jgi:CRISPR-associated protein Csd2|uniref:Type I-C CRISPR-associated protein Cas7/Csd2 n=1 Tax=Ignavibacterium album TaxID=591197 RepID=A0A7V3E638_9BACT|nr:type I-C CRISPR-associated protein Cas7/Csd2 [Ignavibacterium album]MCX8105783.1 type I-C CRISPR-associated protein Cas7/Csd2 [Ignavibacterium album]
MEPIKNRYDFVFYFDVKDGNPNGDPDAGNLPRLDAETGHGLVTDVCIKRKVRNYVIMTKQEQSPYDIFIKEKTVLNNLIDQAHEVEEVQKKEKGDKTEAARMWMCKNYYDIRTFGAVMSTGKNAGQVRGPIQLTFARSVDPIVALEHSITRVAKTTEERSETGGSEMGRKYTVPYGLYRCHGFISAHLANQTGFNDDDLNLFFEAMQNMFEHDRSAARGEMNTRKLIVFKHKTALGNNSAHELFERVTHKKICEGPARSFSDYEIYLDGKTFPETFRIVDL